jgi:hypothetical protein
MIFTIMSENRFLASNEFEILECEPVNKLAPEFLPFTIQDDVRNQGFLKLKIKTTGKIFLNEINAIETVYVRVGTYNGKKHILTTGVAYSSSDKLHDYKYDVYRAHADDIKSHVIISEKLDMNILMYGFVQVWSKGETVGNRREFTRAHMPMENQDLLKGYIDRYLDDSQHTALTWKVYSEIIGLNTESKLF